MSPVDIANVPFFNRISYITRVLSSLMMELSAKSRS